MSTPFTRIATHDADTITVRGANLVDELIGKPSFTEMMFLQLLGRRPSTGETRILDAVLVTLMEHGHTPSTITSRMVYLSCPEGVQSAVAAGLLCVGSTFVGTMEGCATLLAEILSVPEADQAARAKAIATRLRAAKQAVPGFGHPFHKPDDPRSPRLFAVAAEAGAKGEHVRALQLLATEVDAAWGRHLTINATGAIAALLGEIGIPPHVMRGIAVVSRSAGLVGHILEESETPAARAIWDAVDERVPYKGQAASATPA